MYKPIMPRSTFIALMFALCAPAFAQSPVQIKENAPDRYIVEKGDTLWGISGKFLKEPWRWPEIWKLNEEQIKNPNRIYPGNVIVLDRSGSEAQLRLMGDTVKLTPRVRSEATSSAIPSIPSSIIEPFLAQPLVIEQDGMERAPRVVATEDGRVNIGPGGIAYVSGIADSKVTAWQFYRPGKALVDPETQKTLGYEAVFLGSGTVEKTGDPTSIRISSARQEIGRGDRLVAIAPPQANDYLPHAPKNALSGRVLAVYGGLREAGRNSIITLNRGARDGIENGHVLALYRLGKTVDETVPDRGGVKVVNTVKLPDERYGLVFVFRTFEQVSYALVMESSRSVTTNDVVQKP
jgi:LysM repeat protein